MASCSYIICIYPIVMVTAEKYITYTTKVGPSRLDWDIAGIKKALIVAGALKSYYITPKYGRCEDNNVRVKKLALLLT